MTAAMNPKIKIIFARIEHIEREIAKGREYLKSGKHADWHGFRPLFIDKVKNGRALPPHEDWVKNVFLPQHEKALGKTHKLLETLSAEKKTANKRPRKKTGSSAPGRA